MEEFQSFYAPSLPLFKFKIVYMLYSDIKCMSCTKFIKISEYCAVMFIGPEWCSDRYFCEKCSVIALGKEKIC